MLKLNEQENLYKFIKHQIFYERNNSPYTLDLIDKNDPGSDFKISDKNGTIKLTFDKIMYDKIRLGLV